MLVPPEKDRWQALIASGQVIPGTGRRDAILEPPIDFGINASEELAAMRADER